MKSFSSFLSERKISGGLGIDTIPRISDDIKDAFESAGFERATSKTGQNTFEFSGGDMEGLEEFLKVLGYRRSRNNVMLPRNNKVESEHSVAEVGFFGSKVRLQVSASMKESFNESVEMDTLKGIADSLKRQYGLEAALSKSTLGGGEPSYFLKVFGPKDTWTNGISMNSPFYVMFRIDSGELEMITNSYQVRNAKAKMRKTKFKDDADLEKKLMDYFKKNKSNIDGILGENLVSEETVYIQKRMVGLGANQFANDTGFAKKVSNAVTKAGLTAKLQGDKIAVTGDADKIDNLKKTLKGVTFIKEAKASDYTINHKTFSSAVQHALEQVEKQGYTVDDDEWDRKVAMGPRKPGRGKTNSYSIELMKNGKETKRKLQMQVYYDEGRYELNMYIS